MTVIVGAELGVPSGGGSPADVAPSHGNMTLTSNRGSVYLQGEAEALMGWEGLGPVQRTPVRSRPLGREGSIRNRARPYIRGEREIVGLVHLEGRTARARADLMNRVTAVCTPLDGSEVTLSMTRLGEPVTTSGDILFAGGSEFMAEAAYDKIAVVQLRLSCPDPNFYGLQQTARQSDPAGGPFFPIGPVKLADSSGFGSPLILRTGGDRKTYGEFRIEGPLESLRAVSSTGRSWKVDLMSPGAAGLPTLLGGEEIIVRSDPASGLAGAQRVEGPGGVSYWRALTERTFFPLAPDRDTVTFEPTGQSPSTTVTVTWRPAYEAVT